VRRGKGLARKIPIKEPAMLAIIAGTSLMDSPLFSTWEDRAIQTPYGDVTVRTDGEHLFLQRHGIPPLPPHRINHRAHTWALKTLNATQVVAVNSVGSLKLKIKPAMILLPHDFISLWDVPTMFDHEMRFTIPEMDEGLRNRLADLCGQLGVNVVDRGVYVQTRGPRLETKAEVHYLRNLGDIVGMTMASEATLCMESDLPYASLCSIDNYCNGISKIPLTMEEIGANVRNNLKKIEFVINALLAKEF
jgi:purine nucleoside phosphorylase